jgi:putative flavoprotein involved in K+ transport
VVVATGPYTWPRIPEFAARLDPAIVQLHSVAYQSPGQLAAGSVLVVGAGNSGAEIALELSPTHEVTLAGPDTGHIPITLGSLGYRTLRRLRADRWPGSWVAATWWNRGDPLIRIGPEDLRRAGIRRVGRVTGARDGRPLIAEDGDLEVANVVWCTGFTPNYRWIRLPVRGADGTPLHERGVVASEPGLYFVGLPRQSTLASGLAGGVGRDAAYIAEVLTRRSATG